MPISLSPEFAPEMESRIRKNLQIKKSYILLSIISWWRYRQLATDKNLDANLKTIANSNIDYKYDEFQNASHYSLVLYSIPSALYQILDSNPFLHLNYRKNSDPSKWICWLSDKYDLISNKLGLKIGQTKWL
jgi:hypothetical protein